MSLPRPSCSVALLALLLLTAPSVHAGLHLTEFMAENKGGIKDSDGDSSDWIELFNSGPGPVDLLGHYLTDDETATTKWRLPNVRLAEGSFLVIFASEKNRTDPAAELHTNFKLDQLGEYLGLIAPDGTTVITEFGSAANPLPRQFEDVSYGLMQTGNETNRVLISEGVIGKAYVPTPADAAWGTTWTDIAFNDTTWTDAGTGIGYDDNNTYVPEFGAGGNLDTALDGVNTSFYLRIPFELTPGASYSELTLRMKYDDGFVCFLNGVWVEDQNAPSAAQLAYDSQSTANHSDNDAVNFQSFDITNHAHLLQNGTNVLSVQGLNDGLGSSDMLITPELHAVELTNPSIGDPGYLASASPGSYNGDTFGGFVGDTKFNINRGFYTRPFQLQITSTTENAEIRYTTDGSTPSSTQGQIYNGPISISGSTIVRAMAHKSGFQPTDVDTHTYLFTSDVITQSRMRTSVTQSATFADQMVDSLKAVPSISIVTQNTGFLNESSGNIREEYASSVEMIFPDGREGIQENGGLSNYGGRFTNFRKKSFRVAFRSRFGATKLRFPIFDNVHYKHHPPTDSFDVINLRSGSHDMSSRGAYMSNRFTDDSMLDMGNIGPHGRFVHVYLNGNYWGQYHLRERWSADMASSYFGGPESDYEAVNANDNFVNDEEVYDGDGQFWSQTKSLIAGNEPFRNASNHIDVANIIDFMLLWVSGDSESEFRAFASQSRNIPFKFMIKDADGFLRGTSSGKASHAGPRSVMTEMKGGLGGEDFDMLVADRIHKHFFNTGALTPAQNIERLQKRVTEARLGFISESARWGDVFREFSSWENYQNNLVNNHFPSLTNTMIGRFRSNGMYPDVIAPVFSQYGGSVTPTTPITMSTDADTIYYTTDGSDPRLPGGTANPTALTARFGGGVGVDPPETFLTTGHSWNYLDDGSDQGTAWRAPNFDDGTWADGPSQLGYGTDNEGSGTPLSYGPDDGSKFPTTYFRTSFNIPDPSKFIHFLLRLKYDDAAAVYLNGSEIIRTPNLAANASFSQYASATTGAEDSWFDYTIPSSSFLAGINTIAVEIHQGSGSSSDIRMDMFLRGETSVGGGGDNVSNPIFFSEPLQLKARAFNTGTGEWSALNEALYTIDTEPAAPSNLVISELHYHPSNPTTPAETALSNDRDDYEFIEFLNVGAKTIDLTKVRFDAAITFGFPDNTVLARGERLLLVRNHAAFEARYGPVGSVQWFEYTGRLSNDGEQILLIGADLNPILDFVFNDQLPWPTEPDGTGPSLVLLDPNSTPPHGDPANWTASRNPGGSPGTSEPSGVDYASWASTHGLQGGPDDDDDNDDLSNFFEYLAGSRPDLIGDAPTIQPSVQSFEIDNVIDDYLVISYQKSLSALGTLTLELSGDLITWTSDPNLTELLTQIDNGDGTATVTVRLENPVNAAQDVYFARLRGN